MYRRANRTTVPNKIAQNSIRRKAQKDERTAAPAISHGGPETRRKEATRVPGGEEEPPSGPRRHLSCRKSPPETHTENKNTLRVPGYTLAGYIANKHHGIATFVHKDMACPHVKKLDTALNTALRTVSGCLRATPTNHLPVLAGIAPAEARREAAMLALARKAQISESHLLHKIVTETPQRMRLKSRRPFAIHAQELLRTTPTDISKASWVKARWRDQWKAKSIPEACGCMHL
ncbi:hypothetical protein SKAU_G00196980 [Synaphobranchus kaupii]|uniref:Uncharacterized protein n=1 Tax=Synaphobranchus kaupii TaxID=118154 RepID=A0A9Q1IWX3_SYNKA|nr:hypothetical protein SKAU_G00196980 [Synaphobranchus kaupii]